MCQTHGIRRNAIFSNFINMINDSKTWYMAGNWVVAISIYHMDPK